MNRDGLGERRASAKALGQDPPSHVGLQEGCQEMTAEGERG